MFAEIGQSDNIIGYFGPFRLQKELENDILLPHLRGGNHEVAG